MAAFDALFTFWNMLIVILVELVAIIAILVLAGPTGRFFMKTNIDGKNALALIQGIDNKLKFHTYKTDGRNMRLDGKRNMFHVDQIRLDPNKTSTLKIHPFSFNEMVKKPVYLDNKLILMGHEAGGVTLNPNNVSQIADATRQGALTKMGIFVPYSLADIYQLLAIVLTPQRSESIFQAGEIKGRQARELRENVLLSVIVVLTLGVCALAYFLVR